MIVPRRLRVEWLDGPLSIESPFPRLSWQVEAAPGLRGKAQQACRVIVSTSRALLDAETGDAWDTGKLATSATTIEYAGAARVSREQLFWKVKTWDEAGKESPWSEPATWTWGPDHGDWHGQWIGARESVSLDDRFPVSAELEECPDWLKPAARREHPAGPGPENMFATTVHLRKEFLLPAGVIKATLRVAGLGYHEVFLNGRKVGDHVLDPGATDYTKTVLYVTHDVTTMVDEGENCIGVELAGGWYWAGTPDLFGFERAPWAAPPRCMLELELFFNDGNHSFISSDESWAGTGQGPVRFNCIRSGEVHDATMDLGPWTEPGGVALGDPRWSPVTLVSPPTGTLRPQLMPPIKILDTSSPCRRVIHDDGKIVYWFPKNNAGWVEIVVRGKRGQVITIELNEKIDEGGHVDMHVHSGHTYGRFQTLEYTCKGEGIERWHPRFCYAGFQYAQLGGIDPDQVVEIRAMQVATALEGASTFYCSDVLINTIRDASKRTFVNGFHSYPEDCPQREKAGWTEDGQIAARGGMYLFDTVLAYEKWTRDLVEAQVSSGQVPDIVPTPGWGKPAEEKDTLDLSTFTAAQLGNMADPWWGGALVMLPWAVYMHHGDARVLSDAFDAMKRYVDFLERTTRFGPGEHEIDYMINWPTMLGDWLEVGSFGSAGRTPRVLTCTQAFYHCADIVSRVATILGNHADELRYRALASKIKDAFNEEFLDKTTGLYWKDSQSAQAMSLDLGLVPPGLEGKVLDRLVDNVHERGDHFSTGIVGTHFLYQALSRGGRPDLALSVITARGEPGFEHVLTRIDPTTPLPAGTIWEDWGGRSSLCHPVQACVVAWIHETLAGVRPDEPGFSRFTIQPAFDIGPWWVVSTLDTGHGTIRIDWHVDEGLLSLVVEIPVNTTATIILPRSMTAGIVESGVPVRDRHDLDVRQDRDAIIIEAGSGSYRFRSKFQGVDP